MINANIIDYKNYLAELTLDTEEDIIVGRVINTADTISFHAKTIKEAKKAFRDVLDTYLEACQAEGIEPSAPYSGKFSLRITPSLHRQLHMIAKIEHVSMNDFIVQQLVNNLAKFNKRTGINGSV